jgi:hypothetical protein
MIKAYVSYTEARISIHQNPNCAHAQSTSSQKQRHVLLTEDSLSSELRKFRSGEHRFGTAAAANDMWLILDFQDPEFEKALVGHIKRILTRRYDHLQSSDLQLHC